jgi:hypothetical protein
VRVRQGAFAAFDLANQHLYPGGPDFRPYEAEIPRTGVIGRRVRLYVGFPDQVFDGGIQLWSAMPPSTRIDAPVT